MALESSVGDFVVEIILEFSKRVFSDFLLGLLVSYTTLVRTVLSLKNTLSPWNIDIIAVLRVSSNYEALRALRTFHSKLINLGGMEVAYPSFDGVKSDSFSYHVLTTFAANMKRSFIPNLTSSDSLPFNNNKRFFLSKIALSRYYFAGIEVFGSIIAISSCCCQWTHLLYKKYIQ